MAQKRMFTMKIVDSDAFLDMPLSTQCLYFHLNMRADDDGFVGNPKKIMRMIGASEDDFKILLAKKFLIIFENNVVVIKHWWMHNTLAKDRYQETSYMDEKNQLKIKENKSYTLGEEGQPIEKPVRYQNVNKMLTNSYQNVNADIDIDIVKDKDIDLDLDKNLEKPEKTKHKYGTYKNVLLTQKEYDNFIAAYGQEKTDAFIQNFSELKEMKGYKYKSDYLALKKWGIQAYEQKSNTHTNKREQLTDEEYQAFSDNPAEIPY